MWTEITRAKYARVDLHYATDMTDAQWAWTEPFLSPAKRGGRPQMSTCFLMASAKRVEFEGEVASVSTSALEVTRRLGHDWPTVNGWAYWQYEGQLLSELWLEAQKSD